VIVPDLTVHPHWSRDGRVAREQGIRAAWAVPVIASDADRVLGVLTLYHDAPRQPEPADWQLLELAAHLADIAIERSQVQARLAWQATHDALTGLPNRLFFLDQATMALARSQRSKMSVVVLFCDLDRFKFINDSLGHEAGNRLLIALARRLQEVVRPGDVVARFGGDEFTILCEGISDEAHALTIAERVARVVSTPFALGESEVFVTMSVGIAMGQGPACRPEALMENADAAMYRAKARGGNRRELFDQAMRARARRRLAMHSSLYRAIERDEFLVHYQPNVALGSGEVEGVEALVRWQHPTQGLLYPDTFLPLAEQTRLMRSLTSVVLQTALEQVAAWRQEGLDLSVAVNLSVANLLDAHLPLEVARLLAAFGLPPTALEVEITESTLMVDRVRSKEVLDALRGLGVRIAVDDYGTGYSSLAYLRELAVDELKLDKSFVIPMLADDGAAAIVQSTVELAHALGLRMVAEGVETGAHLRELARLGCDVAQGYHISRPVTAEKLGEWLRAPRADGATPASQQPAPPPL
jgi:diguanylate cyclase (GGDEF)-like protein